MAIIMQNLKLTAKLFVKYTYLALSFLAIFIYINYREIKTSVALNVNDA